MEKTKAKECPSSAVILNFHGLLENGVQCNASRFETKKNVNIPLVTSDPF